MSAGYPFDDDTRQIAWELRHLGRFSFRVIGRALDMSPQTAWTIAQGPEPIPGGLREAS